MGRHFADTGGLPTGWIVDRKDRAGRQLRIRCNKKWTRKKIPDGLTLDEAKAWAAAYLRPLVEEWKAGFLSPQEDMTIEKLCALLLSRVSSNVVSKDHLDKCGWACEKIKKYFGAKASVKVLTETAVVEFQAALLRGGTRTGRRLSASSVRGLMIVLKRALHIAARMHAIPEEPEITPPSEHTRTVTATPEEVERLWSRIDLSTKGGRFLAIAIATGMRAKDIRKLDWQNFNWLDNTVTFWMSKRRDGEPKLQTSPMLDPLPAILTPISRKEGPVFPGGYPAKNNVRRMVASLLGTVDEDGKRHPGRPLGSHTFRHTLGTTLGENGVDVAVIKDFLGHDDIKTTLKYVHTSVAPALAARDRMNAQRRETARSDGLEANPEQAERDNQARSSV